MSIIKRTFSETMDSVDEARAVRLRNEYGRVRWIVSWHAQENGMWLARLSAPGIDDTVEAVAESRCDAIQGATRMVLDELRSDADKKAL